MNLTGSPDYGARVRVVGDPGAGCRGNIYQQFNTSAFQGPLYNSVGLESGNDYLRGCFSSTLDLAIARNIRLGGNKTIQLRVDMFNAPNAAGITGRNTTMNLSSPNDPVTITQPAVRRERQPDRGAVAPARRRLRRRERLPEPAHGSVPDPVHVLKRGHGEGLESTQTNTGRSSRSATGVQ